MENKNSMLNLLKDKKGDFDVKKIFLLVFLIGIFVSFIYLVSAVTIGSVVLSSTSTNNLTTDSLTS